MQCITESSYALRIQLQLQLPKHQKRTCLADLVRRLFHFHQLPHSTALYLPSHPYLQDAIRRQGYVDQSAHLPATMDASSKRKNPPGGGSQRHVKKSKVSPSPLPSRSLYPHGKTTDDRGRGVAPASM